MMAAAVIALALSANAMAVSWKYSATKDDVGQQVYLVLGDTAKADWADIAAVAAESAKLETKEGSVAHGTVAKAGTKYTALGDANSSLIDSKTKNYYYVLVNTAGNQFKVSDVIPGTGIYDPDNKESGEQQTITSSNFTGEWKSFSGGDVPEPTTGLLMLVGLAGLALRRKVA